MPDFPGLHHIALTVSSLDRSVPWYTSLFGTDPVMDEDTGPFHHVVWLMGATLLGLHEFHEVDSSPDFDEHHVGLDHVAFGCADRAALETWQAHLDHLGIAHGGIVDAPYGAGLSFRDPDNLPLEFFAPAG